MFRRRQPDPPQQPPWQGRLDAARALVDQQRPPPWVVERLDDLEAALVAAEADRIRLRAGLDRLDADRAARDLKDALRDTRRSPEHERFVASLRERYESIHQLQNRAEELEAAIERTLVDADVLAARSVALASDDAAWRLDAAVRRLGEDLTALRLARAEVSGL